MQHQHGGSSVHTVPSMPDEDELPSAVAHAACAENRAGTVKLASVSRLLLYMLHD